MITGFNQDVTYKNKVYHVQTEDRGKSNPVIESLIYMGGEILASKKTSYEHIMLEGYEESKVAALLEQQHRRIVVDIKLGKYAQEEAKPFGEDLVSSKSLDEVILEYLTNESENEKIAVTVLDQTPCISGQVARIQIKTCTEVAQVPLGDAGVKIRLATSDGGYKELFQGKTNKEGICSASFNIPAVEGNAVVILDVESTRGSFQAKYLVSKKQS